MNTHLSPDFREFLRLLNAKQVEYLVVGGYAVGYHGYPRGTTDLDVWVAVNRINAERVIEVLVEFGFGSPDLTKEVLLQAKRILRMGLPPFRIEVSNFIDGVDFDECYAARITDEIDGIAVNIINLPHLKINKQASGRAKDLNDLENLP